MLEGEQLLLENEILREQLSGIETLTTDIEELHEAMNCLSRRVTEDAQNVDTIEGHVEVAASNVSEGEKHLLQVRCP